MDCGGCGKPVQSDWSVCPFCSCEISNQPEIVISDNVFMGDIKVNDLDDITKAVGQNSMCKNCNSMGSVIIACSVCKELSHCDICKSDLPDSRVSQRLCLRCYDEKTARIKLQNEWSDKIDEKLDFTVLKIEELNENIKVELTNTNKLLTEYRSVSNEIEHLNSIKIKLEKKLPELEKRLSKRKEMLEDSRYKLKLHSKNGMIIKDQIRKNNDLIKSKKVPDIVIYVLYFILALITFVLTDNFVNTSQKFWTVYLLVTICILPFFSFFLKELIEDIRITKAKEKYEIYMHATGYKYLSKLRNLNSLVREHERTSNELKIEIKENKKLLSVILNNGEEEFLVSNLNSLSVYLGGIDVIKPIKILEIQKNQLMEDFHQKLKIFRTKENEINNFITEMNAEISPMISEYETLADNEFLGEDFIDYINQTIRIKSLEELRHTLDAVKNIVEDSNI